MEKGKIHHYIFRICILWLIPFSYALPYNTARIWADTIVLIACLCGVYILAYIIWLRRKNKESLLRAIADFVFYFLMAHTVLIFLHYAGNFFYGYTPTDIVGMPIGETVYGFKAIQYDGWSNLFYIPELIFTGIYTIIYILQLKWFKRKRERMMRKDEIQ